MSSKCENCAIAGFLALVTRGEHGDELDTATVIEVSTRGTLRSDTMATNYESQANASNCTVGLARNGKHDTLPVFFFLSQCVRCV